MSTRETTGRHGLDHVSDQEIEILLQGGVPQDADLQALSGLLTDLRAVGGARLGEEFVRFHAEEAAQLAAPVGVSASTPLPRTARLPRLWLDLRRRATATGMSLVMLLGATGVAWASDSAVPGDWDYGIDRALEVIGIGAGGFSERVAETRAVTRADGTGDETGEGIEAEMPPNDLTRSLNTAVGLDLPSDVPGPSWAGADRSSRDEALSRVDQIHQHRALPGKVDGQTISDIARQNAHENRAKPEGVGPDDERDKQEKSERSESSEKSGSNEKSEKSEADSKRP